MATKRGLGFLRFGGSRGVLGPVVVGIRRSGAPWFYAEQLDRSPQIPR